MNIENNRIEALVRKLLSGKISSVEEQELSTWYNQNQDHPIEIPEEFEISEERLKARILDSIRAELQIRPTGRLWPRIVAAASIVLIAGTAFLVYHSAKQTKNIEAALYSNDVAPGKQGATLTLANGQKILINDALTGSIASQAGVKISKAANGQIIYEVTDQHSARLEYNTLSTTQGEQTQVLLPDGSVVFLNAASSLRYPTSFAKQTNRKVSLKGEGYFEIFKDKAHPFIVATDRQEVKVLGTHFNIYAYGDEKNTLTTLLEGSIQINNGTVLKPGQQADLRQSGSLEVRDVESADAIAWKDGIFIFEEDLGSIMRKVSRWYNVKVEYQDEHLKALTFGGRISRFDNVSQVFRLLQKAGDVRFKIEGRNVTVMKK